MLDFDDKISIYRQDPITWEESIIHTNIEADIQPNNKRLLWWENSNNSEMADYFIFVKSNIKNLQAWDIIKFNDYFWKNVCVKISFTDLIDFESREPFVEILAKLI